MYPHQKKVLITFKKFKFSLFLIKHLFQVLNFFVDCPYGKQKL